jgi:putative transposase
MNQIPITFDVSIGAEVLIDDRRAFITHVLDLESVLVCDANTGHIDRARLTELKAPSSATAMPPQADLVDIPDEDWQVAQRRLDIIRPLVGKSRRTRSEVRSTACTPIRSTVG